MALFKVLKGSRTALGSQELHDGYAYFCVDDGSFHIDVTDSEGVLQRKQVNAKDAETLTGMTLEEIQKSISWDDLNNRPFGEKNVTKEYSINFPTSADGFESVSWRGFTWVKVADGPYTTDDLNGGSVVVIDNSGTEVGRIIGEFWTWYVCEEGSLWWLNAAVAVCTQDVLSNGANFTPGIWIKCPADSYYVRLCFSRNETEIQTLDETYIPDTIARTDIATTTNNGLMSLEDKTKLDGIDEGANKTVIENNLTSTSASTALSAAQGKVLNDSKVDKVDGKGLSTNDYTTEEKTKLGNIEDGANKTVVDTDLSLTSENPVQNKVVTNWLGENVKNYRLAISASGTNDTSNYVYLTSEAVEPVGEIDNAGHGGSCVVYQLGDISDTTADAIYFGVLWDNISGKTVATTSANGLMSSTDKAKINALDATYATIDYVDELVGDIESALATI